MYYPCRFQPEQEGALNPSAPSMISRIIIVAIYGQPSKEGMKVKDLIAKLSKLDPDLEVVCIEDGGVPLLNDYPGPFEIVDVNAQKVVTSRDNSGRVSIKFDHTDPSAWELALIGITSDI